MDSATQSPSKIVVWVVQSEASPTDPGPADMSEETGTYILYHVSFAIVLEPTCETRIVIALSQTRGTCPFSMNLARDPSNRSNPLFEGSREDYHALADCTLTFPISHHCRLETPSGKATSRTRAPVVNHSVGQGWL